MKKKLTFKLLEPLRPILGAVLFCMTLASLPAYADQIDVGIFESGTPGNQLEVRLRPDYQING
ncbi:MAG: hypothetical protein K8R53_12515, partial [Bacteroidales bacterium]|nr:hypothetical protein [Bacteroidales bacterium]